MILRKREDIMNECWYYEYRYYDIGIMNIGIMNYFSAFFAPSPHDDEESVVDEQDEAYAQGVKCFFFVVVVLVLLMERLASVKRRTSMKPSGLEKMNIERTLVVLGNS